MQRSIKLNSPFLKGIIPPLITPFDEKGELDETRIRKEISILLEAGVDGISPGGSTGEGAALDDDEIVRIISIVREMDARIPIVAGVIRNSTKAAVRTALLAKDAGANALMVTPVSYNVLVPDEEGNFQFYKEIGEKTGLPIVIYNVVPQNTISATLFSRLLEIPEVDGIKQSVGGISAFYEMKMACGEKGKIFSATDEMLASTFQLGADGAISAILTVFPDLCVEMWNLTRQGKYDESLEIQNRVYSTWKAIAGNQFPIRIKYALQLMGRDPGYPRSPICNMSDVEKESIQTALQKAALIA
jgi:4-hydroxy-tetrahydrodipicolinate synthase